MTTPASLFLSVGRVLFWSRSLGRSDLPRGVVLPHEVILPREVGFLRHSLRTRRLTRSVLVIYHDQVLILVTECVVSSNHTDFTMTKALSPSLAVCSTLYDCTTRYFLLT